MKPNYEEAKLRTATSGISTSIRVMDKPSVSDKPVNKNFSVNALAGLALGFFAGVGLVLLLGTLDDRLKSVRDLEGGLGIPVLGTVPKVSETAGPDRALLARQDKDRQATEAVRAIYSAMKIDPASAAGRVFLVTSTRPGEGKTFAATNLALAFAQHAERVIVVDADLRLPNVGPSLGFAGDGGVSRWFSREMTLDEAIVRMMAPGLDVPPVGLSCATHAGHQPPAVRRDDRRAAPPLRPRLHRLPAHRRRLGRAAPHPQGRRRRLRRPLQRGERPQRRRLPRARLRDAGAPMLCAVLNQMSVRLASVYTGHLRPVRRQVLRSARSGAGPKA
jgi:hypothetical protein